MLFSGIPFMYYFLPTVVLIYFLAPGKWRNGVLLLSSLLFYGWGEPKYILLMLVTIFVFFGAGLAMGRIQDRKRQKTVLSLAIAFGVLLLGIFKYLDFFLSNFGAITGLPVKLLRLALPIGISFYTFQCMSYVIDVYRGNVPPQKNIVTFGAYVALFPQLIAGPIVRYVDVAKELESRNTTWDDAYLGARRFVMGLAKKVLLANQLGQLTEVYRASQQQSVLFAWMYAVAFTLHIYFDFSGYSDMAIGLGRIFGFHFPENFNYPYLSRSITEFWRRWHMTLGGWFRDYVYIPLGGNRVTRPHWVFNILVVWMLTGLWHGASWNFVIWGLFFAALLLLEKLLPAIGRLPETVKHIYVMLLIIISFVIFNGADMAQAGRDLASMFGAAGLPLVTGDTIYYLRSYAVVFLLAIVGSAPLMKGLEQRLPEKARAVLEPLGMLLLLLLCTAYLVDGSFNPFLYFRF